MASVQVGIHAGTGLQFEHLRLLVECPDPGKGRVYVMHKRIRTGEQHGAQGLPTHQSNTDLQAQLAQAHGLKR